MIYYPVCKKLNILLTNHCSWSEIMKQFVKLSVLGYQIIVVKNLFNYLNLVTLCSDVGKLFQRRPRSAGSSTEARSSRSAPIMFLFVK